MKFTCDKSQLTQAVTNVSRVIPAKSSVAILEGIQIKASENQLHLTGYDMEAGITTVIEAQVEEEGEIVLSARLFSDMLRKMADDEVQVSVGDKLLTEISSGMTHFTILGSPSNEYPELPKLEESAGIALPQAVLKSMIDQTHFAIAVTDVKPVHTGSLFDIKKDELALVSVDGFRLAIRQEQIRSEEEMSFVVPGKALFEISKLLGEEDDEQVFLHVSSRHIVFHINNYSVVSRLLEGEFLDYSASIPDGAATTVRVSTRAFIDSIERVSLLISDRVRSPLRVLFEDGRIKISCSTSLGHSYDELECQIEGPAVEMGFNNKYLLDALKAAESDEVSLEINGALSPAKVLPLEGEDFLFLVLPVRLKNEA